MITLDKGILMTFGSGLNGCLGHANYEDVATVEIPITFLPV